MRRERDLLTFLVERSLPDTDTDPVSCDLHVHVHVHVYTCRCNVHVNVLYICIVLYICTAYGGRMCWHVLAITQYHRV